MKTNELLDKSLNNSTKKKIKHMKKLLFTISIKYLPVLVNQFQAPLGWPPSQPNEKLHCANLQQETVSSGENSVFPSPDNLH